VDIDESEEQQRTIVKPGVDHELDELKDTYSGLESLLKKVATEIASEVPSFLDIEVNVIYFPQLGFNIAVPFDQASRPAYNGGEQKWEQIFTTENRAYFKNNRMRQMDEHFGDLYGTICGRKFNLIYLFHDVDPFSQKKKSR
jgi:DNA mismatch repair protein MSH5